MLKPGLQLVDEHIEDLACNDWYDLARRLVVDPSAVDQAVALVRSLNPRPGGEQTDLQATA